MSSHTGRDLYNLAIPTHRMLRLESAHSKTRKKLHRSGWGPKLTQQYHRSLFEVCYGAGLADSFLIVYTNAHQNKKPSHAAPSRRECFHFLDFNPRSVLRLYFHSERWEIKVPGEHITGQSEVYSVRGAKKNLGKKLSRFFVYIIHIRKTQIEVYRP